MLKSFFNWRVLLNILLAIGLFLGLVWLTFRWLEYHTHHGEEIPVPNVVNMSLNQAVKVLDDTGLEYEVDSFKFDPKYKPLQVLQIFPSPGSRVKGGRAILLKVNPKTYAKVAVPDILDRYKGLAFRQLEQVGLKVGDTLYEPSIQRDAVIRMMLNGSILKPGTLLPRFTTIDLVIGSGPKRNISIPNVVGLTVKEAKAIIAQNLFEVGLVEHDDDKNDDSDIVYYQDPAAFSVRDQGMQIDLWASKKSPAELRGKIDQLNSIYHAKIDTTMSSSSWDEPAPVVAAPKRIIKPEPKADVSSSEPKVTEKQKSEDKPKVEKPKSEDKPKAKPATSTSKPEDKPKAKKVVIE